MTTRQISLRMSPLDARVEGGAMSIARASRNVCFFGSAAKDKRPNCRQPAASAAAGLAGCWEFNVGCRKFTDGCACRPYCKRAYSRFELGEYGFLEVRLPSHSDRIADITEGPSRAIELNRSRGRFPGESLHEAHWRPA